MSYRTYADDIQVFGNNEYYPEWLEFIKSQGIEIDDEGRYEGELHDFMAAVEAAEAVVLCLDRDRIAAREGLGLQPMGPLDDPDCNYKWLDNAPSSLFDLSGMRRRIMREDPGMAYRPRLFDELLDLYDTGYLSLPLKLYRACEGKLEPDPGHPSRLRAYRLKPGESIRIRAS